MATVHLHLKNLPPDAVNRDIRRFFVDFNIPEGGIQIVGGTEGEAFVTFNNYEDLLKARSYDKRRFLGRQLLLNLVNNAEIEKIVKAIRYKPDANITPQKMDMSPPREMSPPRRPKSPRREVPHTWTRPPLRDFSPPRKPQRVSSPCAEPPWQKRPRAPTPPRACEEGVFAGRESKRMRLSDQGLDSRRYSRADSGEDGDVVSRQKRETVRRELEKERQRNQDIEDELRRNKEMIGRLERGIVEKDIDAMVKSRPAAEKLRRPRTMDVHDEWNQRQPKEPRYQRSIDDPRFDGFDRPEPRFEQSPPPARYGGRGDYDESRYRRPSPESPIMYGRHRDRSPSRPQRTRDQSRKAFKTSEHDDARYRRPSPERPISDDRRRERIPSRNDSRYRGLSPERTIIDGRQRERRPSRDPPQRVRDEGRLASRVSDRDDVSYCEPRPESPIVDGGQRERSPSREHPETMEDEGREGCKPKSPDQGDLVNYSPPGYVMVSNLDPSVTYKEVREFFAGYQIARGGIILKQVHHKAYAAYIKMVKLDDALNCDAKDRCVLRDRKVHVKMIFPVDYDAQRHPEEVKEKRIFSPPPRIKKEILREHEERLASDAAHYLRLVYLPPDVTACEIKSWFKACVNVTLISRSDEELGTVKTAYVEFPDASTCIVERENYRLSRRMNEKDTLCWIAYASYNPKIEIFRSTDNGDEAMSEQERTALQEKCFPDGFDQEAPDTEQTPTSLPSASSAQHQDAKTGPLCYLEVKGINPDMSSSHVWQWFGGRKGAVDIATVIETTGASSAFLAFRDPQKLREAKKKYDFLSPVEIVSDQVRRKLMTCNPKFRIYRHSLQVPNGILSTGLRNQLKRIKTTKPKKEAKKFYLCLSDLAEAETACGVWSWFGESTGATVVHKFEETGNSKRAFVEFPEWKLREEASLNYPKAKKINENRFLEILGRSGQQKKILQSTWEGVDHELTMEERGVIRNKIFPTKTGQKPPSYEPTSGRPTSRNTPGGLNASDSSTSVDDKKFILAIRHLADDETACEVWSWFGGSKGASSGVTLSLSYGDRRHAFVEFTDAKSRDEAKLKYPMSKKVNERYMLGVIARCGPEIKVFRSTESGVDHELTVDERDALRDKIYPDGVQTNIAQKPPSSRPASHGAGFVNPPGELNASDTSTSVEENKKFFLIIFELAKDETACGVWSWFGGSEGGTSLGVTLRFDEIEDNKRAFVEFTDAKSRDEAKLKYPMSKKSNERYILRAIAQCGPESKIFQSTESGVDRELTMEERDVIRKKIFPDGIQTNTGQKPPSNQSASDEPELLNLSGELNASDSSTPAEENKKFLFHILNLAENTTACRVWSWFGGRTGTSFGVTLVKRLDETGCKNQAFVEFPDWKSRNEAQVKLNRPHSRKSTEQMMLDVLARCGPETKILQSTESGVDREMTMEERDVIRNKIYPDGIPKGVENEVREKADHLKPHLNADVSEPPTKYFLSMLDLPLDTTACEVWSWYGGAAGTSSGVTLVHKCDERGDFKYAYVEFMDMKSRKEAMSKYPASKSVAERQMLRRLGRLAPETKILQSTKSGVDRALTVEERDAIRNEVYPDGLKLNPDFKAPIKQRETTDRPRLLQRKTQCEYIRLTDLKANISAFTLNAQYKSTHGVTLVKNAFGLAVLAFVGFDKRSNPKATTREANRDRELASLELDFEIYENTKWPKDRKITASERHEFLDYIRDMNPQNKN